MQSVTWKVHILNLIRHVESCQDAFDLRYKLGRDASSVSVLIKSFQPPVTESDDHAPQCNLLLLRPQFSKHSLAGFNSAGIACESHPRDWRPQGTLIHIGPAYQTPTASRLPHAA